MIGWGFAFAALLSLSVPTVWAASDDPPDIHYDEHSHDAANEAMRNLTGGPALPPPPPENSPVPAGRSAGPDAAESRGDAAGDKPGASPGAAERPAGSAEPQSSARSPRPVGGPPPSDAAAAAKGRAMSTKAKAMAETLKTSADAGSMPPPAGGPAAAAPMRGGAAAPSAPVDPANPLTLSDLGVSAASGFKSSFDALGMKTGRGPRGEGVILNSRGVPASSAELARLREKIASDPKALMRYPDFFDRISREKFEQLKVADARRPGDPAFKDVAFDLRDFGWSRSCAAVSGDCNSVVKSRSYDKGQEVPPDDLDAIWAAIDKSAAPPADGTTSSPPVARPGPSFAGDAWSTLQRLAGALSSRADSGPSVAAPPAVGAAPPEAVAASPSSRFGSPAAPPSPASPRSPSGRGAGIALALPLAAAAALLLIIRRDRT
ncbi:MAG: hypothetical protein ACHQ49_05115 [Elusimicrobiota bacterium]